MDRIESLSLNLEKNNIDKIKELFPEAVEEGKINFDMLRAMLGDEVDDSKEKYQFTWNGKAKSIKLAQTPSSATLRPCKDKSKNWDTTENLYIEGDNLEVLKQLQKTYYGKIKMIYIDPPYNTGNDFVYHDDFRNSIDNYKNQTNQTSSSNPESSGRFHTDWLNMMYPRLMLAKNLLKEDGVIFISIDDNEIDNLKKICREIFGDSNVEILIWNKEAEGSSGTLKQVKTVRRVHEYVVCVYKSLSLANFNKIHEALKGRENEFQTANLAVNIDKENENHPNYFSICNPSGEVFTRQWKWGKDEIDRLISENLIYWGSDGHKQPRLIIPTDNRRTTYLQSILNYGGTTIGRKEFEALMNNIEFSYPKPLLLLRKLIETATAENDIIVDFFSGSATTAQAIMQLNENDKKNRKYVMVQLPELCDEKSEAYKAGYKNICEIGEERIRRAGEQIKTEWEKEHPSDGLFGSDEKFTTDIGFKVFKLDSTNVNEWDPNMKLDEKELAMRLGEVFKEGRSKEDILYEIMLKYGVFDKQAEEIDVNGKTMYRVGKRYMIVCLNDHITSEDVKAIGELSPRTVIFNEAGFDNDNDKINAVYNLEKAGVEDVKCI